MLRSINKFLASKFPEENHPEIEYNHCVNSRQHKNMCAVCGDVCVRNVPDYGKAADWDACGNCNICTTQCPSRAIRPSSANVEKLLGVFTVKAGYITIACRKQTKSADLKLHCAASVPWEVIAALALEKHVLILKHECEACENRDRYMPIFDRTFARVEEFLGGELFRERIRIVKGEQLPEIQISRRELFFLMRQKTVDMAETVLPGDGSINLDGTLFRGYLLHRVKQLRNGENAFGWRTLTVTERCWGCGLCVKICPHQAISMIERDDKKYMAHSIWKCTECGSCKDICPEQGISDIRTEYIKNPFEPVLTEITYSVCTVCGKPVKPGAGKLCVVCLAEHAASKGSAYADEWT